MAVSDEDRRRMMRLARDLEAVETDEPASPQALAAAVTEANRRRLDRGLPRLADEPEPPEEEFYRRARALGLRRSGRGDPRPSRYPVGPSRVPARSLPQETSDVVGRV